MEVNNQEPRNKPPYLKFGPVEYILYETRRTIDGAIEYDAVSAEDYEQIFPVLICCSFPMNTIESFHQGLFTAADRLICENEGELSFLRNKIKSVTHDRIDLFPISRTLYELFYLREYLYTRVGTDFAVDSIDEYFAQHKNLMLIKPFFLDHNHKFSKLTIDEFAMHARAFVLQDPYLCLLHYELNAQLVDYFKRNLGARDWTEVCARDLEHVIDQLCADCEALQRGQKNEVARELDVWPLTSPGLATRLEQMFEKLKDEEFEAKQAELEQIYAHEFTVDLKYLKKHVKSLIKHEDYADQCTAELIKNVQTKAQNNPLYGLLYDQFCADLSHFDLSTVDNKLLNGLLTTINIIDKVDTCVDRFRKRSYIDRELLKRCIQLEMEPQPEDMCFLYRASNNMDDECAVIKDARDLLVPHSLSFGPSLFAGAMHDKTATVYNYLIQRRYEHGYIIKLPKKEFFGGIGSKLFFVPPLPSIVQLASIGELFHPRSKVFIQEAQMESREHFLSGILNCSYARAPLFLLATEDSNILLKQVLKTARIIIK